MTIRRLSVETLMYGKPRRYEPPKPSECGSNYVLPSQELYFKDQPEKPHVGVVQHRCELEKGHEQSYPICRCSCGVTWLGRSRKQE